MFLIEKLIDYSGTVSAWGIKTLVKFLLSLTVYISCAALHLCWYWSCWHKAAMPAWAFPFSADNPLMKNFLFKSGALTLSFLYFLFLWEHKMKFYLCSLISGWPEISMCMWRVIVLSIFLMIGIQDLFSFGMVLIFKTYITNIVTYLMKNMLFQEQYGRKSSLWNYGVTRVTPFCIGSK